MWTPPFLYPPPASMYLSAMSAVTFVALVYLGLAEFRGDHLAYSKFFHVMSGGGRSGFGPRLSSRAGMLLIYTPALVAAAASFAVPGVVESQRAQVLSAALTVHFLKRVLEVLFVHRYSGNTPLATASLISSSYLLGTIHMIYSLYLSRALPPPAVDLLYPGIAAFAIGIAGNFYHHYLLSKLRPANSGENKAYKIPKGGLFEFVTCPHYLFEIIVFFGFAMISQTVFALAFALGTAVYLVGRSCATRRWYQAKFDEFPARIKALVPFIL